MPQPSQLPGPASTFWDWQLHGACRGAESAVFFHPGRGTWPGPCHA